MVSQHRSDKRSFLVPIMLRTLALFALAVPALLGAQAPKVIRSSNPSAPLSRITKVQNLVERDGLTISLTVQDLGGTTDVSPTKQLFLSMYRKGEMYIVDATFDLGAYFDLVSAARVIDRWCKATRAASSSSLERAL